MTQICEGIVDHALTERLATFPRYAQLPLSSLSRLVAAGVVRSWKPDERVLEEGRPGTSVFIVLSGRLKMTRALANGRRALLALFGAGDLVGIAGFGGRPSAATVVALEFSVCLEILHRRLLTTLEARPRLVGDLLPVLTEQVVECRNCAIEGTFFRVEPRFARLFLKLGEAVGRPSSSAVFIPVRLSRQDLADMAGTTIETTIRIMSRWGKEGIIETRGDGFLLQDRPALEGLCGD